MSPPRSTGPVPEAEHSEHAEHAGQYRLEECLGSGGMGVVHLATSASGLRLAVKVVHAEHATEPEFRARFRQEVAAARRVSGAFTAPVVDADPEAARPWMATLFIDGPTLSERVKRNGPLGVDELRRVGSGLAEALRDIHRAGVVHRDLKPSNVLLAADGPKVIDFGISRPSDSDLRTETGKLIGTPPFMAPEQFQRPRDVGPAADVFAMGAVLVHAATGRGPFDSDSPYIVAYQVVHNEPDLAGVPAELAPLLARCLAKQPEDRPTPGEVMAELRAPAGDVATAFIPLQRGALGEQGPGGAAPGGPEKEEEAGARSGGGSRGRAKAGAGAETGAGAAVGRRRGVRKAVIGVAVAALLVGAYAGVRAASDDSGRPAGTAPGAARPFAPWQATLAQTGSTHRTPVCSSSGESLYCSAPGVMATRLDTADGKPLWSRSTAGSAGSAGTGYDGSAPVLSGGLLHVNVTTAGGGGKRLEALDPESGATRWGVDIGSHTTVGHGRDSVLLIGADGAVQALHSASGEERWRKRHGGTGTLWAVGSAGPTESAGASGSAGSAGSVGPGAAEAADASGSTAYAVTPQADGASTIVRAVSAESGDVRWEKRLSGLLTPVRAASDGSLFLLAGDADGFATAVVRLDTATREVRRVELPVDVDQAQAEAAGSMVYVVGAAGSLLAIDTAGGEQRWRVETYVSPASRPVVDDGRVYLSGADGRLVAVDAERGEVLGQTKPRMSAGRSAYAPRLPAPVVVGGKVFATAPDGSVFAVDGREPGRW
ncbi:PQQ-binding-like beta-propeller repeat protein [Streptomyces sp. NPDC000410]|uniref:protein kinase domain-containing protein n=1 Tax=Streptomyces sp. NPDC000410 TaxID=3154254 RepID=UPI00331EC662